MKRLIALLLIFLLPVTALAASKARTKWTDVPEVVRPGKAARMTFYCPVKTTATVTLLNAQGKTVATLCEDMQTVVGENELTWDGTADGEDVTPGTYTLRIALSGKKAETDLTVGTHAPELLDVDGDMHLEAGWTLHVDCSTAGTVIMLLNGEEVFRQAVTAGENDLPWDGQVNGASLPEGAYELEIRLVDDTGFASVASLLNVEVAAEPQPTLMHDADYHTPSNVDCDHDVCYWRLNMGEMDVSAIWQVLTAPVTVLKGNERQQAKVYAQADAASEVIAEVTYASQAVHVLEKGDTWTRIEGYSSSVEGSKVANFGGHFVGYVKTSLLQEKQANQHIGIVVDKLTQRLYVFQDGRLLSTLLCSTGYSGKDAWNETPAGEYLVISRTGGFWSGSLYCDMGLRINDGILLHEVPCLINETDNSRDYSRCERYLGEKASHGCIRTQRKQTPEGINMQWLWDNIKVGVKVLIWDEVGRVLDYPDDDVTLYYNPDGGKQYHSSSECLAVKKQYWPLTAFTWGELDEEPYASLTACPACAPQPRREGVDALNDANTRTAQ